MKTTQKGEAGLTVVLIIGAIILLGAFAYFGMGMNDKGNRDAVIDQVSDRVNNDYNGQGTTTNTNSTSTASSTARDNEVAFTVKMGDLSAEQRAFLKLRGVEGDEIKVTNKMVTCANAKLGSARVTAIRNGAELSMSEKVQLLACYE